MYIKECAFMSNTWEICLLQMNLKHLKCKFPEIRVNFSFYKILVVQLKLKCWLEKPLHDDIIEAKKVYI